jgi:branched-chain amino acid transport system ATP-binding protein
MTEAVLEIRDLVVSYGRVVALRGVSLGPIRRGELVGVVGRNGAGKSTLLRAIAGVARVASGSIVMRGRDLRGVKSEDRARRGLMLVPERRRIFTRLTVRENLRLGSTARRDRTAAAEDVAELVERFPILAERLDQPAGSLSGGQQQQLAIARALASRPVLLLVDEPSLGLAPQVVDLVFETLAALRDEGVTILLIEQNARRTLEIADRSWILDAGRARPIGADKGVADALLSAGYLGAVVEAEGGARG